MHNRDNSITVTTTWKLLCCPLSVFDYLPVTTSLFSHACMYAYVSMPFLSIKKL